MDITSDIPESLSNPAMASKGKQFCVLNGALHSSKGAHFTVLNPLFTAESAALAKVLELLSTGPFLSGSKDLFIFAYNSISLEKFKSILELIHKKFFKLISILRENKSKKAERIPLIAVATTKLFVAFSSSYFIYSSRFSSSFNV